MAIAGLSLVFRALVFAGPLFGTPPLICSSTTSEKSIVSASNANTFKNKSATKIDKKKMIYKSN